MATHDPTFCDITWGAGGTTADLTLEIAGKMQNMVCQGLLCQVAATTAGGNALLSCFSEVLQQQCKLWTFL